jgi:hypothetical protein
VTCATGPATGNSVALNVPVSVPTFPQDFGTGIVDPNCWTASALVGTDKPDYNAVSAFGVGTGSARFNFYAILPPDELALTSPEFAPTPTGAVAVFDVAGTTYINGEVDEIYLEESNDGGVTWNTVVVMDNGVGGVLNTLGVTQQANYVAAAADWVTLSYPVTAGTNRIRFRGVADFGNNVFIDNAGVSNSPSPPTTPRSASGATTPSCRAWSRSSPRRQPPRRSSTATRWCSSTPARATSPCGPPVAAAATLPRLAARPR